MWRYHNSWLKILTVTNLNQQPAMKTNFVSRLALWLFKWPAPICVPYFCMLETAWNFPWNSTYQQKKINAFCMALLKIEQRSFQQKKQLATSHFYLKCTDHDFFLSCKEFNNLWKTHESILRHDILKPLTEKMNENN